MMHDRHVHHNWNEGRDVERVRILPEIVEALVHEYSGVCHSLGFEILPYLLLYLLQDHSELLLGLLLYHLKL